MVTQRQNPAYRLADESPAAQLTAGLSMFGRRRGHRAGSRAVPPVLATAILCHHEGMNDRPSAAATIAALRLEPHREGGYFRETYRAPGLVDTPQGPRAAATAIAFLVTLDQPSRFHRLLSGELWVYRAGAPLELWLLEPGGEARRLLLGPGGGGLHSAEQPSVRVASHVWQGARVVASAPADTEAAFSPAEAKEAAAAAPAAVAAGGAPRDWSLVSCIVTPGFEYADFELGRRDLLLAGWPQAGAAIDAL
jgi:uncharacterized protein